MKNKIKKEEEETLLFHIMCNVVYMVLCEVYVSDTNNYNIFHIYSFKFNFLFSLFCL